MPTRELPAIDYHAHHSPWGAHASFTLGRVGRPGGFGLELTGPASQDVYIGFGREGEPFRALPFYEGFVQSTAAYTGREDAGRARGFARWRAYKPAEIRREMGWASDAWGAGELAFRLLTPFGPVPDPERGPSEALDLAVLPAILAELTVDNRRSARPARAFFGVGNRTGPLRGLAAVTGGRLAGAAHETVFGLAADPATGAREVQGWNIADAVADGVPDAHRLGSSGGLLFPVPARRRAVFTIALGFHRSGTVTSGLPASYWYGRTYPRLEEVLAAALERAPALKAVAAARDRELARSRLTPERRFLLAHATHSYLGSTQLLEHEGRPLWVVHEGEYRMMNTFDLTVDQVFHELTYHPWTVRNVLDLYAERYSFRDRVQDVARGRRAGAGGISFTHDMGVANQFSPPGESGYEKAGIAGCFSHMTMEQLANWILTGATYAKLAADAGWTERRLPLFLDCLASLLNRDAAAPRARTGVMKLDSSRVGATGEEITTYDSLDVSLGQARNNLYLAVKTWAACVALEDLLARHGEPGAARVARDEARRAARTVAGKFDARLGYIPAVFEKGNVSAIIPAVEGLVFPWVLGLRRAVSPAGPYGRMVRTLKRHLKRVLRAGTCLDRVSGGWKMSSTSGNTWQSKIALGQFVVRTVLGMRFGRLEREWDRAHAKWQREGGCRDVCYTDQIRSTDGKDLGSRFYPRGVTAILWLQE